MKLTLKELRKLINESQSKFPNDSQLIVLPTDASKPEIARFSVPNVIAYGDIPKIIAQTFANIVGEDVIVSIADRASSGNGTEEAWASPRKK